MIGPAAIVALAGTTMAFVSFMQGTEGHAYCLYPPSRAVYNSKVFANVNGKNDRTFEYQPSFYNAKGQDSIRARAKKNTNPAVLADYGGGDEWPSYVAYEKDEVHPNGNYYQSEELSKRAGICGDPKQVSDEGSNTYSTPNIEWPVLETFEAGSIIDIKAVMRFHHWGHFEFFLCNTEDMDDPKDVVTQSCLNRYPLTRADGDDNNSPIDPAFPGRYYVDAECRENEVDQSKPEGAEEGQVMNMRYRLPDITCEHCVLQMIYYAANNCKHVGYEEFNPPSWPSSCAPNKDQWVLTNKRVVCGTGGTYPEEFWQCSDISLVGGSNPAPSPMETEQPVIAPTDDDSFDDMTPEGSTLLGCFSDSDTDRIMTKLTVDDKMTAEMCEEGCIGNEYFGMQWGIECWCGGDSADHTKHGESAMCDFKCGGNTDQTCGGYFAMTVYGY